MSKLRIGQAKCPHCGYVTTTGGISTHVKHCSKNPDVLTKKRQKVEPIEVSFDSLPKHLQEIIGEENKCPSCGRIGGKHFACCPVGNPVLNELTDMSDAEFKDKMRMAGNILGRSDKSKAQIYSQRFSETDTTDGYLVTPIHELTLREEIFEAMEEYAQQFTTPVQAVTDRKYSLKQMRKCWNEAQHSFDYPEHGKTFADFIESLKQ